VSIQIKHQPGITAIHIRTQPGNKDRFVVSSFIYSYPGDINWSVLSTIEETLKETPVLHVERVRKNERVIDIYIFMIGDDLRYSIYHSSPCEVDRLLKDKLEEVLEEISRTYGDTGVVSHDGFGYIPFDISWFNTATDSFKKGVINNAG
jgi:hypothetical protein